MLFVCDSSIFKSYVYGRMGRKNGCVVTLVPLTSADPGSNPQLVHDFEIDNEI